MSMDRFVDAIMTRVLEMIPRTELARGVLRNVEATRDVTGKVLTVRSARVLVAGEELDCAFGWAFAYAVQNGAKAGDDVVVMFIGGKPFLTDKWIEAS